MPCCTCYACNSLLPEQPAATSSQSSDSHTKPVLEANHGQEWATGEMIPTAASWHTAHSCRQKFGRVSERGFLGFWKGGLEKAVRNTPLSGRGFVEVPQLPKDQFCSPHVFQEAGLRKPPFPETGGGKLGAFPKASTWFPETYYKRPEPAADLSTRR